MVPSKTFLVFLILLIFGFTASSIAMSASVRTHPIIEQMAKIEGEKLSTALRVGKMDRLANTINRILDLRLQFLDIAVTHAPNPELTALAAELVSYYDQYRAFDESKAEYSPESYSDLVGKIENLEKRLLQIFQRQKLQGSLDELETSLQAEESSRDFIGRLEQSFLEKESEYQKRRLHREAAYREVSAFSPYYVKSLDQRGRNVDRINEIVDLEARNRISAWVIDRVVTGVFGSTPPEIKSRYELAGRSPAAADKRMELFQELLSYEGEDPYTQSLAAEARALYVEARQVDQEQIAEQATKQIGALVQSDQSLRSVEAQVTEYAAAIVAEQALKGNQVDWEIYKRANAILETAGGWPLQGRLGQRRAVELQNTVDALRARILSERLSNQSKYERELPEYNFSAPPTDMLNFLDQTENQTAQTTVAPQ